MKVFEKYKFINRFTKLPRVLFLKAKEMGLSFGEFDILSKLLNYSHFETITPNLTDLSQKTWISVRTYQRSLSSLQEKGIIQVSQNKVNGKFSTNSYDISAFFVLLQQASWKQLTMDFDSVWTDSSIPGGFIFSPVILDSFQKELWVDQKECLFLKYLILYMDDWFNSEISLNYLSKISPLWRSTLTRVIQTLEEKWIIETIAQFSKKGRIRTANMYNIKALFQKINELERKKVQKILEEKWEWRSKKPRVEELVWNIPETLNTPMHNTETRIAFLENEINNLQNQCFAKNSQTAELIREYQEELSQLKYTKPSTFADLILQRIKAQQVKQDKPEQKEWKAKYNPHQYLQAHKLCDTLKWNWKQNSNFYLKIIATFPNTYERYQALAMDAKIPERYFLVCLAKKLKQREKITS